MKTNHSIVKALMVLTIAFGVQTTANAQFGGFECGQVNGP